MTDTKQEREPVLTIAIPSYNRAGFLRALLERLMSSTRDLPQVEVLVSDNASSDATPQVCRDIAMTSRLVCFRNESNIGFDRNYLACIARARGEYVWVLGDDDLPEPAVIERVLHHIATARPSMIVLNGATPGGCRVPTIAGLASFDDFNDFFARYGYHFTWISTTVLQRRALASMTPDELGRGRYFIHLALQLKSFLPGGRFLMDFQVGVRSTDNVAEYQKVSRQVVEIFAVALCGIVDMQGSSLDAAAGRRFLRQHHDRFGMFTVGFFLRLRADVVYGAREFMTLLARLRRVTPVWPAALLVQFLPAAFSRTIVGLHARLQQFRTRKPPSPQP